MQILLATSPNCPDVQVEHVKERCLPGALNYPMLEEYDFLNDTSNPSVGMQLKPIVKHRPYQVCVCVCVSCLLLSHVAETRLDFKKLA